MAFANGAGTHDEPRTARAHTRLIRMKNHARIAESRTLNGIFARECRTKQQAASRGQVEIRVEAVGQLVGVSEERFGQAVMSTLEPRHDVVVAPLNFVLL